MLNHPYDWEIDKKNKSIRNSKMRPKSNRGKSQYRNTNYINSIEKRDKTLFEDNFYFLQASLNQYVKFISPE
jgi:hypothetical protein